MKKKDFSLNKLLANNKFLFVLAILISASIWLYMTMSTGITETSVTLHDIPIQIELSDEARNSGLQIFSGGEQTASVTVTGNRVVLGSINNSYVTVTAAANSINSTGNYNLPVSATKTNPSSDFQITSTVVPSTINVVVDYFRESSFMLQENVVYKVADGYYAYTSLSSKSVNISGPQTEISKIDKVSAVAEINGTLSESAVTDAEIIIYDKNGKELSTNLFTMDIKSVQATVSVLPEKTVNVIPDFVNKPSDLNITSDMISIEPSTILLAGPSDLLDKTDSVKLETIDFSTLKNEKIEFPSLGIDIPTDCKNISNATTAKVTLDLSQLSSKSFSVANFEVEGLSDKYSATVTQKNISVTIIGPKSEIDNLTASDITAVIDMSDSVGTIGSVQKPVKFKLEDANSCWAYGTYKANLTIAEK